MNTGCIIAAVSLVEGNYVGPGGLINDINWIFILNAITGWLLTIFNPEHFYLKYRRYRMRNSPSASASLTQREANNLFEGMQFDISFKYAVNIKIGYFAALYAPVLPMGVVFSLIPVFINYWIDKVR